MFDAEQGGVYDSKSRRYTCPDCAARQYAAQVAALAKKQRRRMVIKLIFGVLFIISGFSAIGKYDAGTVIATLLIGVALVAWALLPRILKARKSKESEV
jgi:uncharacterized membrane protein YczE